MRILLFVQLFIIIFSIVLLYFKESKAVNTMVIVLLVFQLLLSGFTVMWRIENSNHTGPHCSEAYNCQKSSKDGMMDCVYLVEADGKNEAYTKKVQCPAQDGWDGK